MTFDRQSKIKDVLENPVGRDIVDKILMQLGKGEGLVDNPVVRNMKLSTLKKASFGNVDDGLIDTVCHMLNNAADERLGEAKNQPAWWKEAVFYQIYPRS
ncbi:MAG: alpha-glucosidase, partial [Oscillospiraceae bacterium]|nr:alpha-glucosidase [Oscillospiraceae bacterium]